MKKIFLTAVAMTFVLAGCSQPQETKMTQEIQATETVVTAETGTDDGTAAETAAQAETTVQAETQAQTENQAQTQSTPENASDTQSQSEISSGDIETDEDNYFSIKAEKDAVDIEIDNLEASYRIGEVDEAAFLEKKRELEAREDELERQEERLEDVIDRYYRQNTPALESTDVNELQVLLQSLSQQENELEQQEDALEMEYRSGEKTREEFITEQKEILRQLESVERQEEQVEDALEMLGWDD